MKEPRFYKIKDIQKILDCSRPTAYKYLMKNEFEWIRLREGGTYLIEKESFDDWLRRKGRNHEAL